MTTGNIITTLQEYPKDQSGNE
uniref:Uncharacterized protein n=1 Tax=Rhizophora mucronata TaxID=61149 RepID=A0A2P2NE62_RHIMU